MFRGYATWCKFEIIEIKDPIVQVEASKPSIKDLFNNLLNETKGFKYQITVKVLLKKYKLNGEIEFALVYFNSITKTVITHRFRLENFFQEVLYMIDAWINEGSGWIVESVESQYINISTYRPLSGSSYMNLPIELRNPRKGLINIKNKDQKCFLWCHVRHINPSKEHPKRIRKIDKKLASNLNYDVMEFPVQKRKIYNIYINRLSFLVHVSNQKFEGSMDLLLLIDGDKSHYLYIKDFNRSIFHKTKNKNKKWFCFCNVLVVKIC